MLTEEVYTTVLRRQETALNKKERSSEDSRLHALPVSLDTTLLTDNLSPAPPKFYLILFCICMNYTLCVPHFCVKLKKMKQNKKDDKSITERIKNTVCWWNSDHLSCLFFLVANY